MNIPDPAETIDSTLGLSLGYWDGSWQHQLVVSLYYLFLIFLIMEYSSYITQEDILAKNIRCKKSSKSIIVQNKLVIYGHNNQEISGVNLIMWAWFHWFKKITAKHRKKWHSLFLWSNLQKISRHFTNLLQLFSKMQSVVFSRMLLHSLQYPFCRLQSLISYHPISIKHYSISSWQLLLKLMSLNSNLLKFFSNLVSLFSNLESQFSNFVSQSSNHVSWFSTLVSLFSNL